jgi:23S rRNA pseudouridine2605 synthase
LGSRRHCEELILAGRVEVDRQVVAQLGTRVDPQRQDVRVDGVRLKAHRLVHYLVNKPAHVVSTNRDPAGRQRVIDLLPPMEERVFPVGRLDLGSEGLMLLTNDGELANQVTHPRYGVEKTYLVQIAGEVDYSELARLKRGVFLSEGFARVVKITIKSQRHRSTLAEIVLNEGRNREIRRLLARAGHKVMKLKRIAIGPLRLGALAPGEWRRVMPEELKSLREAVREARRARKSPRLNRAPRPPAAAPDGAESAPAVAQPPFEVVMRNRRRRPRPAQGERGPARGAKAGHSKGNRGPGKPGGARGKTRHRRGGAP